ncbi:methyltransferase domain-containing protein [Candidatus Woesearchaeota archaeon]|nr:methyltransferase domain-containing protein [Candidatus Woesearchaeota archaeon]
MKEQPTSAPSKDKKKWQIGSYEDRVQRFYGWGVENYGDYHGGYLNFGLWDDGNTNYLVAAEHLISTLATRIGLNKKSKLLDVACGLAAQDVFMATKFGCQIDAIDVTWKHVSLGRARVDNAELAAAVRVHHGSATKLPFANHTFTHVMGIEGPAHFDTREDFFREAYRVLKPGGTMGLSDYILARKPKGLLDRIFLEAACFLWHAPKENRDTIPEYEQKLLRTGFTNVRVDAVGERVIPGYYFENKRPETRRALPKIRGWFATYGGAVIDYVMYKVFRLGVIEYILVTAEKPKSKNK